MKKTIIYALIFCIPFFGISQVENETKSEDNSWNFSVTPYLWKTSLNGKVTVLNQEDIPVDLTFKDDIISNLKMAAMFHAEARKDRLSFMLDVFYAKLGEDSQLEGPINTHDTRVRLKQNLFEGGLGYTFARSGNFSLDALVGARFFDVNVNLEIDEVEVSKKDFNFLEPYIGVRFRNDWNKFSLGGRADIGGFGLGTEYSYKLNGYVGYQFTKLFGLTLGYQLYRPDYQEDNFVYNVGNQGFLLGFNFEF